VRGIQPISPRQENSVLRRKKPTTEKFHFAGSKHEPEEWGAPTGLGAKASKGTGQEPMGLAGKKGPAQVDAIAEEKRGIAAVQDSDSLQCPTCSATRDPRSG
ncbi:Hypothetical predicted protein, partial [Marmota monax]